MGRKSAWRVMTAVQRRPVQLAIVNALDSQSFGFTVKCNASAMCPSSCGEPSPALVP